MSDPTHVLVDPYLLCLPTPCHTEDQLDRFCEGLLAWAGALDRDDVVVLMSVECIGALISDGLYPYQHNLRRLLATFSVTHFDHETVCSVVQMLVERTKGLEESVGVRDILFDQAQTHMRPDFFRERLGVAAGQTLEKNLVLFACCGEGHRSRVSERGMASRDSPDGRWSTHVSVVSHVLCMDLERGDDWDGFVTPRPVESTFPVLAGVNELMDRRGGVSLWRSAESEQSVRDAIDHEIRMLIAQNHIVAPVIRGYRVGDRFIHSVRKWGFDNRNDWASVLIESIARIILGMPKNPVEPFRTGAGSSAGQISRQADGAAGWRTHLTKHGAGFRLMFWECMDGTIELANVGDKDELMIER